MLHLIDGKIIRGDSLELVEKVDNQLQSLNKKDKSKLMSLIRKDHAKSKKELSNSLKIVFMMRGVKTWYRNIQNASIIISLYEKAEVNEIEMINHWEYYRQKQIELHKRMNSMAKPKRQDNKTYINRGSEGSNANSIRYPKKCRKTAWKRFYRLFPHLKPEISDNSLNS